jgi:hypothetical protein
MSVLIKRENIVFIFCLPVSFLYYLYEQKIKSIGLKEISKALSIGFLIVVCIVLIFVVLHVVDTLSDESFDIKSQPFSIKYMFALVPVFIKGYLNLRWYLFFSLFFFLGIISIYKIKKVFFPLICFLSFFVLYNSHYRSYYFVHGGSISPEELIRYMVNIMPYYVLISGAGLFVFLEWIIKNLSQKANLIKFLIGTIGVIIIVCSFILSANLRDYFLEDEFHSRINPVVITLKHLDNNDFIISKEFLVFQVIGSKNVKVIDFEAIGRKIPTYEIDKLIKSDRVIYLCKSRNINSDERERYSKQYEYLESKRKELIDNDNIGLYKIYKLKEQGRIVQKAKKSHRLF